MGENGRDSKNYKQGYGEEGDREKMGVKEEGEIVE